MAVWALSQLMDRHAWTELKKQHLPTEMDKAVREEWNPGEGFFR